MLPPLPPVDAPVPSTSSPLFPELDVPELNKSLPLVPEPPAFMERTNMAPDDAAELWPLSTFTRPPVCEARVLPD